MSLLPIEQENPLFGLYLYPEANSFREAQQDISWFAQEIKIEKDIQDYRVNMTADELELVEVTLQLFVEIEQSVGDIWDTIATWFPHSEIEGCCSAIASMEKSVHAFFYQKMSDELHINPEDTARVQQTVKAFKQKLDFLEAVLKNANEDRALTLATVTLIEQVLLFSNFAMLKSFQANGHNLIANTISGVDYVVNDEVLHGEFSSYLFKTYVDESKESDRDFSELNLHTKVLDMTAKIIIHEDAIIDHLFVDESKYVNGINKVQLKQFIRHRANNVLTSLGMKEEYTIVDSQIAKWFYKGANSAKMHDFFVKGTNSYSRTWSEKAFSRLGLLDD